MSARRVVIAGGGITGLSAAYYLERMSADAGAPIEITLVERDARLGGKLGTERTNGLLVDIGPDSFLAQKPAAVELCREIGLGDEIISPLSSQFYMYTDGSLHSVPHELVSLVPAKPEALWKTSFLSLAAKTRASAEALVKPRGNIEDESLSSFMRRRFGDEFAAHFAEPLMGGVHAGDPERMSMAAIYPMFWEMERKYGSITRALLERRLHSAGAAPVKSGSPFVALRSGMQSLVDRLCERLGNTHIQLGRSISGIVPPGVRGSAEPGRGSSGSAGPSPHPGQYTATLDTGEELLADAVLLATPAYMTARLIQPLSADAAKVLADIPYASSALATFAYRREDVENTLQGTGFLVPRDQGLDITGCTWSSNKWEARAPDGLVLMRAFMGYAGNDEFIGTDTDEGLCSKAHRELSRILSIRSTPIFSQINRWRNAMPQYEVGHLARIAQVEQDLSAYPGLRLAGSAFRGVGIPDCVRQAKESAEWAIGFLQSLGAT